MTKKWRIDYSCMCTVGQSNTNSSCWGVGSNILQNETEVGHWALASLSEWGSRLYSCRVVILPCSGDNYTIYCLPWGVKQTALPCSRSWAKNIHWVKRDEFRLGKQQCRMHRTVSVNGATSTGYPWLNITFLSRWVAQCWLGMENAHA